MLNDKSIDVIHNCTPNFMHLQVNKDILNAGKHCISEKPLGMNSKESAELVKLAKEKKLVNAVNFNYRYYPLVQQARMMVKNGQLGRVFAVQGCYMQDWLLYDTDWSWRLDPKMAGDSRVMGDIGSHWFDLIQFVTGKKIVKVFADLSRFTNTAKNQRCRLNILRQRIKARRLRKGENKYRRLRPRSDSV
jgi:predicted dehydrogenase